VLCYTHGDASTLHDAEGDLASIRVGELALAGQMPGAVPVRLLGYPDGALTEVGLTVLSAHVVGLAGKVGTDGLIAFGCDGVAGHPAHPSVVDGYRDLRALAESRIGAVRELAAAFFGDVDGAEPVTITEPVARDDRGDVVVADVRPQLEVEAGASARCGEHPVGGTVRPPRRTRPAPRWWRTGRGPYCLLSAEAVAQLRDSGRQARRLDTGPIDWHPWPPAPTKGQARTQSGTTPRKRDG
jgi:LmbE family N-acetylglucosaminyl deacetylase